MPTLPNTGVITPTPGGDAGTWDDKNNAAWANYDDHRHESGNGLRIRTAGIDINADLTFGSLYAPTNLHRLTFASIVALTDNNKSLFVNASDNELYWRSNTGTNVKLTTGNALNVAAFTGGFGAGYTSASAAADYDDSTEQYTFKQATAGNWSRLGVGGIRLYEFGTSETLRVGLLAPAALAGSYDVTFPEALPPSASLVQMSSAGVLTASNTGIDDITLTANKHFTVSGTGLFKHGNKKIIIPSSAFQIRSSFAQIAAGNIPDLSGGDRWSFTASIASGIEAPVSIPVGATVRTIKWWFNKNSQAASLDMHLRKNAPNAGNVDVSSVFNTSSGSTDVSSTASSINYVVEDDVQLQLVVLAGHTAHQFLFAVVTYDQT